MLVNSLRTWPPCVTVGPSASAAADEMEQGGYGKEDAIANDTNFDMRVILYEGCVTYSIVDAGQLRSFSATVLPSPTPNC